jgi:hypothetical protein
MIAMVTPCSMRRESVCVARTSHRQPGNSAHDEAGLSPKGICSIEFLKEASHGDEQCSS